MHSHSHASCFKIRGERGTKLIALMGTALMLFVGAALAGDSVRVFKVSSLVLRRLASVTVEPPYPVESVRAKREGKAVLRVQIDPKSGLVHEVVVLEAPDDAISKSVQTALKQWHFLPSKLPPSPEQTVLEAPLVFYFRFEGGRPVVIDAAADEIKKKPLQLQ